MPYLAKLPGPDKVASFLSDVEKYETSGYETYTNNRQSIDLGFDVTLHDPNHDTEYIRTFVQNLEKQFDLVLISDYFDESLVLLRRHLNWETKDIVHIKKHTSRAPHPPKPLTPAQKQRHASISVADRAVYEHFLALFLDRLHDQGAGLKEEVKEFQTILVQVQEFCGEVHNNSTDTTLVIPAGRWSSVVSIDQALCDWLALKEVDWTAYQRKKLSMTRPNPFSKRLFHLDIRRNQHLM